MRARVRVVSTLGNAEPTVTVPWSPGLGRPRARVRQAQPMWERPVPIWWDWVSVKVVGPFLAPAWAGAQ